MLSLGISDCSDAGDERDLGALQNQPRTEASRRDRPRHAHRLTYPVEHKRASASEDAWAMT